SLSPLLHNTAFTEMGLNWVSVGFPVAAGQAEAALAGMRALRIVGLSVTMPHKDAVARLVDRTTPVATRLGAVNCVSLTGDELVGSNTDGAGFVAALRHGDGFDPDGTKCLVIGAGGAARAVVLALAEAGAAEVIVVNRTESRAVVAAALAGPVGRVGRPEEAATADLVVNATPTGMERTQADGVGTGGDGEPVPLDIAFLAAGQVVVDLVYHPASTSWLQAARDRGAVVHNGLGMLVHQAAVQLRSWTGEEPPVAAMWQAATAATSTP
ncbi:MAG TPA: shikimate dehydrogenase, partial [Acidimicrobiales bacterium]|nr:shikimate dehydrogenase [Acidimicrobiales bacterium]